MARRYTDAQWADILDLLDRRAPDFGLPERREDSVVLASFNIRKLGRREGKSAGAWSLLGRVCERFDLIAIQEVQDDLEGLNHLRDTFLGGRYGMVCSDITGATPGADGMTERLAFLYRRGRVERTEVASDITYDRSAVVDTLYDSRMDFWRSFDTYTEKHSEWEARIAAGGRRGTPPVVRLPRFVTFIRQPLCVSFRIAGAPGSAPYELLAVNAHLLYGRYKSERRMEFEALMTWLVNRAHQTERLYHKNLLLLGDLNLDFRRADRRRDEITGMLKGLNGGTLVDTSVEINLPFISAHPTGGLLRSNARLSETFDQIALLIHDQRLPDASMNEQAGRLGADGFDYGVFNFVELFRTALGLPPIEQMTAQQRKDFFAEFEHDFTDHLPIWVRLPRPRADTAAPGG